MIESVNVRYVVNAFVTEGQPFLTRQGAKSGATSRKTARNCMFGPRNLCLPAGLSSGPE
jgi:hypothetical protein